jgi:Cysteine-rich CPXCG
MLRRYDEADRAKSTWGRREAGVGPAPRGLQLGRNLGVKQRSTRRRSPTPPHGDGADVDALYGLDPVFEPDGSRSGGPDAAQQFHPVRCPYCGEGFEVLLDPSAGSASYIEDCQICCRPIQLELAVDHQGSVIRLDVSRSD